MKQKREETQDSSRQDKAGEKMILTPTELGY